MSKNQKTCRFYSCQKTRKLVGFSLAKKNPENLCVLLSPKKNKKKIMFYLCQKNRKLVGFTLPPKKTQKTFGFYSSQKKQKTFGFYSSQKNRKLVGFTLPKKKKTFWVLFSPKTNIGASCFFSVHSTSRSKRLINSELECFLKRSGLVFLLSYKKIENGKNHGKYVGIFHK